MHLTEGTNNDSGRFTDGPPATTLESNWTNAVLDEIKTVIINAGFALKTADTETGDQLDTSIRSLIASAALFPFAAIPLSNFSDLDDAVGQIGSTVSELWVDQDDTMAGNIAIPSTLTLRFINGKTIDPNGNTLTIASPENIIAGGRQKIFNGLATIKFTNGGEWHPQWFGALADNSNNDQPAIQAGINALKGTHQEIIFLSGIYKCDSELTLDYSGAPDHADNMVLFRGGGGLSTQLRFTQIDATPGIRATGTLARRVFLHIIGMYITGTSASGAGMTVSFATSEGFKILRSRIQTWGNAGLSIDNSFGCEIGNAVEVNDCNKSAGTYAVNLEICSGAYVAPTVESNTQKGIRVKTSSDVKVFGIYQTNGGDHVTLDTCISGLVSVHTEDDQADADNGIVLMSSTGGNCQGVMVTGCAIARSSDTTYDSTKAPIKLDQALGCIIEGNNLNPNDGNGNSPHFITTANTQDCTFGRNLYQGNRYAVAVNPLGVVHASSANIQFTFLKPRTYKFLFEDFQANLSRQDLANGYGVAARTGTKFTLENKSYIVGIGANLSAAVTTSTLDFNASGTGGESILQASFNGSGQYVTNSQYPFGAATEIIAAGTEMGCEYNTGTTFAPITLDGVVEIDVLEELEQ